MYGTTSSTIFPSEKKSLLKNGINMKWVYLKIPHIEEILQFHPQKHHMYTKWWKYMLGIIFLIASFRSSDGFEYPFWEH